VRTSFTRLVGLPGSFPVAASAEAVTSPSGTGKCVKPFAIPSPIPAYSFPADDGRLVMVWQKSNEEMLLIGDIMGTNSGAVIRDITRSPDCKGGALQSVGQGIAADVPGQKVGPVTQGIDEMVDADPNLVYNTSTGEFTRNGVAVTDWRQSPRVANVVLYDKATFTGGTVQVADVVTIYFYKTTGSGNNAKAEGRIFRSVGIADNCVAQGNCSPSILYLRLVR
jgi:hypothetical protein